MAAKSPIFTPFGKADQICWYAQGPAARDLIKITLGLQNAEWVKDIATGQAKLQGQPAGTISAELEFNYDLGVEVEILTYFGENHMFRDRQEPIFFSHIGIHVDEHPVDFPGLLVQELMTTSHTNPYLNEKGRTFHYKIYDAGIGVNIKFIKRVHHLNEVG